MREGGVCSNVPLVPCQQTIVRAPRHPFRDRAPLLALFMHLLASSEAGVVRGVNFDIYSYVNNAEDITRTGFTK